MFNEEETSEREVEEVVSQETEVQEVKEENTVPLATYTNERKKRQEAQLEADWYRQQAMQAQQKQVPEEDEDDYESLTKKDWKKLKEDAKRELQEVTFAAERKRVEGDWIAENPEKTAYVDQNLETFLKQNQHLATAINNVPNRYGEAYKLMDALSPKKRKEMETKEKKPAPNSASAVPKSTAMRNTEDVMTMSDKEFLEYRKSKKIRR